MTRARGRIANQRMGAPMLRGLPVGLVPMVCTYRSDRQADFGLELANFGVESGVSTDRIS